ncbi:MAG: hypothetical protein M5F18_12145 [Asgard group archaeon]|nr:hypothetical protein [Asgard group archaeon]
MAATNNQIPRGAYKSWLGIGAVALIGGAYMLHRRNSRHEPGCNCRECFRKSGSYKNWGPRERPNAGDDFIKD